MEAGMLHARLWLRTIALYYNSKQLHCAFQLIPISAILRWQVHCAFQLIPISAILRRQAICCNALTLNNPRDSDLDYLVKVFQLRHRSAETRANRLLDWAKPGHFESSDQSAVNKTDGWHQGGYQRDGCPCWISSGRTAHANYRCCYFLGSFEWKNG